MATKCAEIQAHPCPTPCFSVSHRAGMLVLFFASGCCGLVYEVLWIKELGLLFGNTAYAAATTLAAFFLGLTAGGYVWGRQASRLKNPLKTYGVLEACIAASACCCFVLFDIYWTLYSPLFRLYGDSPGIFLCG